MKLKKPIHPTNQGMKVLYFIANQKGTWCTWGPSMYMPTVHSVFEVGVKEKVQMRFVNMLIHKELVDGCNCGCRGDYVITKKGLQALHDDSLSGEQLANELLMRL